MRTTMAALLAALGLAWANPEPPTYYLEIPKSLSLPPEAASVALAGALAADGPGVAASFFNPAALSGLPRTEIAASWGPWQSELWQDKSHAWVGTGFPVGRLTIGADASLTSAGKWDANHERYDPGISNWYARDATLGARVALACAPSMGAGLRVKVSTTEVDCTNR